MVLGHGVEELTCEVRHPQVLVGHQRFASRHLLQHVEDESFGSELPPRLLELRTRVARGDEIGGMRTPAHLDILGAANVAAASLGTEHLVDAADAYSLLGYHPGS